MYNSLLDKVFLNLAQQILLKSLPATHSKEHSEPDGSMDCNRRWVVLYDMRSKEVMRKGCGVISVKWSISDIAFNNIMADDKSER